MSAMLLSRSHSLLSFSLAFLILGFTPETVRSQWSPDPALNTRICDVAGEQGIPKVAATADGGTYVSWFDSRGGSYAVYLQRLDSLGLPQWAPDGLLISSHPQNTWLVDYDLDVDAQNNAVIVFCDIRNGGEFNPFAYKISQEGLFLWGPDGITLSDSTGIFQAAPRIRVTTDGGATMVWSFLSTPNRVAMQRVSSDGIKLWGEQPVFLSGSGQENLTYPSLVASDSGSVIVLWSGYSGSFLNPQNYRLYTQKFSPQAIPLWGSAPDTVYGLGRVPGFLVPRIMPDGDGGAIYGWYDDRGMTNLSTSYVQHFTSEGIPQFPPNGSAVSTTGSHNHFDVSIARIPPGDKILAAWVETNALQTQIGLTAQKFSGAGERLWGPAGLTLFPFSLNSLSYVTVTPFARCAFIWWNEMFSGGINVAVRGIRLDSAGVRPWGDSLRTVSSAPGEKLRLAVATDRRGVSTLIWSDRRADAGGIYGQTVRPDGSLGNPPVGIQEQGTPATAFALEQSYPNPFNPVTTISFIVPAGRWHAMSLKVFNVLGQLVATLAEGPVGPGVHKVEFDASGLPGGAYYYTLSVPANGGTEGFRATRAMVLLK